MYSIKRMPHDVCVLLVCGLLAALAWERPGLAQDLRTESPAKWTLDAAREQLQLYPNDVYLQYVALQLADREGVAQTVGREIESLIARNRLAGQQRTEDVNLFSLFSGALAVQESLQLDTMTGAATDPRPGLRENGSPRRAADELVSISDLQGPTIQSHPWAEMLAGRKPGFSVLATLVPEDQYYVRFTSISKLLEVLELKDTWGEHLFSQTSRKAYTSLTEERLLQQLALQTNDLLRPFYDLVVKEVAITGSDLYLREGSDATLLFRFDQPTVFRTQMETFLAAALASHPEATRSAHEYRGVPYVFAGTPDRRLHLFAADVRDDVHVRSNSQVGLQRVIDVLLDGGTGEDRSLAQSDEFAYIRTLMPHGAKVEDGFIYLSDPFIRRLVGPELKLTERRRVLCANHLRMIGHACALFETENRRPPESLDELVEAKCCPGPFNAGNLTCPCGGQYALSAEGRSGVCSHHGRVATMVPCCEIAETTVTGAEAELYEDFVTQYNQYWRTFFDPIAIRVTATPEQYRLETIILPLINNSIYQGLARGLGGEPQPLDLPPIPARNIFTLAFQVDKQGLLEQSGWSPVEGVPAETPGRRRGSPALSSLGLRDVDERVVYEFVTRGVGNRVGLHVYDGEPTFDFKLTQFLGQSLASFAGRSRFDDDFIGVFLLIASLNSPVYVSLPLDDVEVTDRFLAELDRSLAAMARENTDAGWFRLERDFYTLPLDEHTTARSLGVSFGPIKWRFFWARIGRSVYIASKPEVLQDITALTAAKANAIATPATTTAPASADGLAVASAHEMAHESVAAHAMVRIRPKNWAQMLPNFQLGWAESHRLACLENVGRMSSLARLIEAGGGDLPSRAHTLYGVDLFCPCGGGYETDGTGTHAACTVHGSARQPRQPQIGVAGGAMDKLLEEFSEMTLTLTFLEDGLHATLHVDRQ